MSQSVVTPSPVLVVLVLYVLSANLAAQDSTPAPRVDTAPPLPVAAPVVVAPPAPTPEQERYIEGLKSVARGVRQLRDGIGRVERTQQGRDSVRQRDAGRRLGGLCQSARTFISSGRHRLQPSVYVDSMRIYARQVTARVDSVLKALPGCVQNAGKSPVPIAADLSNRLKAYEQALLTFRTSLMPPKTDSLTTPMPYQTPRR